MANRTLPLLAVLAALLVSVAPVGAAQDCSLGVEPLCDAAESAFFTDLFGQYGDIALAFVGLLLGALVVIGLLSLVRQLRPESLLRFEVAEKMRELEPGASARFKLELENRNHRYPVDVFLERPELPAGWTQEVFASILLPSGFRVPQAVSGSASFPLTAEARGANRAAIEVRLKSPADLAAEETLDYELKAVPVFRGRLRKAKAKRARLTALVTPHVPVVQILKVQHEPEQILAGTPVLTRAFLANTGERDATDVAVMFALNGQEIDKKIVPRLSVAAEAQVEFNWVPQAGENKIRVALEA